MGRFRKTGWNELTKQEQAAIDEIYERIKDIQPSPVEASIYSLKGLVCHGTIICTQATWATALTDSIQLLAIWALGER